MDFLKKVQNTVAETAAEVKKDVEEIREGGVDAALNKAKGWMDEKAAMLDAWKEEKKNLIRNFIASKLTAIFDYFMAQAAEHIKENAKDPYMPMFVQNLVDDAIDAIWPDLKLELKEALISGLVDPPPYAHGEPMCCGVWNPLAFLRYHLWPYDRSIWRQLRDPIYWIFLLTALIPKWGATAIVFMILFLLMDKGTSTSCSGSSRTSRGCNFSPSASPVQPSGRSSTTCA